MSEVFYIQEDAEKREATEEEIQAIELVRKESAVLAKAQAAEEKANQKAMEALIEKLGALGLTVEEVKLLKG
jgi:tRNA C32,U32 (ribose-2'-O)-methylase TrmJ